MAAAADGIPYLYRFLKQRQPKALWEGDRTSNKIALTFDDGPHPTFTPALLEVLAQYNVKATFFWLGACVERNPEVARAVYEQGHWLGIHSYDHRLFLAQSSRQLRDSLDKTRDAIAHTCQINPNRIYDVRPPYGICTNRHIQQLQQWGYRTVMWSVVPIDWTEPGVSIVAKRIQAQTRGGDILVLHDGYSGGASVAQVTSNILPALKQRFTFTPLDQMDSNIRHGVGADADAHPNHESLPFG